ncbi:MAG: hypothetical protein LBL49_07220 [Clostridiales Family XIII bacterium]|jgi:hypothetical protein|nr:hypothetical protein [Clostridiales Family XIII bacterium]
MFAIKDTGAGTGRSEYWIDLFFGANNAANRTAASNWGVQIVNYAYSL